MIGLRTFWKYFKYKKSSLGWIHVFYEYGIIYKGHTIKDLNEHKIVLKKIQIVKMNKKIVQMKYFK